MSRICDEFSQIAKGKVVRGSIPGRVICERHSGPLSLHYIEREVCAARLPASLRAHLSNTDSTQPSGRGATGHSVFEAGRPSTCLHRPIPGTLSPHLPSPARVTRSRYPAQMEEWGLVMEYILSGGLACKADGFSV